jgi:hypothetical protein
VICLQVSVVLPTFTVSFTSDLVQVLPTLCLVLDANAVPAVKQMLPLAMPRAKMAGANRFAPGFFIVGPFENIPGGDRELPMSYGYCKDIPPLPASPVWCEIRQQHRASYDADYQVVVPVHDL